VRLFVALELPEPAHAALAGFRDAADPAIWRPVSDQALHITLAFLGNRPEEDAVTVAAVLRAVAAGEPPPPGSPPPTSTPPPSTPPPTATPGPRPAPPLALGAGLLLPPRRPRVLCADVADPTGGLAALQAAVAAGLEAAGVFTPERRAFRAHATVARLRPGARAPRSIDAAPEPVEFAGGPLTLFESRLHPHGARYAALTQVSLA
jgi:RNA 2',3'-cyclic 3'-phosphodiesterase